MMSNIVLPWRYIGLGYERHRMSVDKLIAGFIWIDSEKGLWKCNAYALTSWNDFYCEVETKEAAMSMVDKKLVEFGYRLLNEGDKLLCLL